MKLVYSGTSTFLLRHISPLDFCPYALLNTRTISGNKEDPKLPFHHDVQTLFTPVNISQGRFIFERQFIGICLKK